MLRKANHKLTPAEVIGMGLREFESRFGFRPKDAIEKHHFAATGERITPLIYEAIVAGVLGDIDVSHVNMGE